MKKLLLTTVGVLLLVLPVGLTAQAQGALEPGVPVQGEISDSQFAVEYTYEGTAQQVIVIEMFPVDSLGDLDNPAIILRDPSGADLARYDSFGRTTLIWELPEDGTYTIVATRRDDAGGTSVGEYTLTVKVAVELALDEPVTASMTMDETHFYVYRGDDDFVFSFARQGEFAPEFTVNTIDTEITPGTLDAVAVIGGKSATVGSVGNIPGGQVYVIQVSQALFDFYFDEVSADYALRVSRAEE